MGEKKPKSEELAGELRKLEQLKQKAEADLTASQARRKHLREQKKKLHILAYQNDRDAVKKRNETNKQLIELELEEGDLADTVAELTGAITKLTQQAGFAKRQEAGERILARQGVVAEKMKTIWAAYETIEREIKSLWELTREEWSDCAVVGIRNMSSRKFCPVWHLPDILDRLVRKSTRDEPLGHEDFLLPLPELVAQSQKAAQYEINEALKKSGPQIEERKVA